MTGFICAFVIDKLRELGAREGDTIRIGEDGMEFDYIE